MARENSAHDGQHEEYTQSSEQPNEAPALQPVKRYKTTPIPYRQLVPMTFVLLSDVMCFNMLSPFIGLLVARLQNKSPDEAGYLTGTLLAMFMLGQLLSGRAWGKLSDMYGRRLPLICGLSLSGIVMLFFGLSSSVWMLAVCRFFHGLVNGNVVVAKTMMADITDVTNEAIGFSFVSLCNGVGLLIGPAIGGILYDPINSDALSWLDFDPNGIFSQKPALLPSLFIFAYSVIGVAVCTIFVQESNPKAVPIPMYLKFLFPCLFHRAKPFVHTPLQELNDAPCEPTDSACRVLVEDTRVRDSSDEEELTTFSKTDPAPDPVRSRAVTPVEYDESTHEILRNNNSIVGYEDIANHSLTASIVESSREQAQRVLRHPRVRSNENMNTSTSSLTEGNAIVVDTTDDCAGENTSGSGKQMGYRDALRCAIIRSMIIQYVYLSGADVIIKQCVPLWAISSVAAGGLGMNSSTIGFILLMNSIPTFTANYFFHKIYKVYSNKFGILRLGLFFCALFSWLLPCSSTFTSTYAQYILLLPCICMEHFFAQWCYALNTLLMARAAPRDQVGAIMGISQSFAAIARGLVPLFLSPLFAWSISSDHVFPFNYPLVFIIAGILFMACWQNTFFMKFDSSGRFTHDDTFSFRDRIARILDKTKQFVSQRPFAPA